MLKNVAAKFDRLQIEAKCVPKVCKPIFVKLANSMVCKIPMIKAWGVGLLTSLLSPSWKRMMIWLCSLQIAQWLMPKKCVWHGTLSVKNMGLPR
jgi:hypothetical protein